MSAVVFDLDGTLIDSVAAVCDVANMLMNELALPPLNVEEARVYIGNGAGKFLERALSARGALQPDTHAASFQRFLALYAQAPGEANVPYPGAEATLRRLAAAGHAIGLCTNKPLTPTQIAINALGWTDLFDVVIAGDMLEHRKPHPQPLLEVARRLGQKAVIYVGDSKVDEATAKAAGIPFVLYTEGYRTVAVDQFEAAATFSDFNKLPDVLSRVAAAL